MWLLVRHKLVGICVLFMYRTQSLKMKQNKFPPGWDENRVRRVLAYYERQTEEEALAGDKAAGQGSSGHPGQDSN